MSTVIKVENLSKYYRLGLIGGKTLHDDLNRWWARVRKQPDPLLKIGQEDRQNGNGEYLWALRDINFEVQQGEIVGIIGRNGAGKSTLLKILSRITAPTSGQVKVKGRIASLLEVGTGFHPELTGRENIYLNGAILGMKKAEIDRKFDEIVAFAEVEKFIDTPVKRYSSGMYVRLAFAVAAHLEPEILIVDEVLAVGDAAFQKKCLGKMGDVAREGRTVLFVSHNMHAIASICESAIWLHAGLIKSIGSAREQVAKYISIILSLTSDPSAVQKDTLASVFVQKVRLVDEKGEERDSFGVFEHFAIELRVVQQALQKPARLVIRIRSAIDESVVLATTDWDSGNSPKFTEACARIVRCLIPANLLNCGSYFISVGIDEPMGPVHFRLDNMKSFTIVNTCSFGPGIYGDRDGTLSPYREWAVISVKRFSAG